MVPLEVRLLSSPLNLALTRLLFSATLVNVTVRTTTPASANVNPREAPADLAMAGLGGGVGLPCAAFLTAAFFGTAFLGIAFLLLFFAAFFAAFFICFAIGMGLCAYSCNRFRLTGTVISLWR